MCSPLSLRLLNEKEPSMQYKTILDATFLSRPNRFIAKALLDGKEETVQIKTTGHSKELLLPEAEA